MSRLKELTEYKTTIIQRLVGSQNILKAVYYQAENFLDEPFVNYKDVIMKNIYPYNFVPSTDDEVKNAKTYITLSISDYKPAGNTRFRAGSVLVYAFTHKSLVSVALDTGDLRIDYLVSEIDNLLSDERGIGIGKLEFLGMREFLTNNDYLGYVLSYRPVIFN